MTSSSLAIQLFYETQETTSMDRNSCKCVIVLVLSALLAASAEPFRYHDCPPSQGPTGHALSVELSPCPVQPCTFKHGDTVSVTISFTAGNDSDTLESTVYGIVAGIPVKFPLPNPDGCKNSGISCPIKNNQTYTYHSSFDVLDTYPEITLVVMWKLNGATSNDACFTFPMSISDTPIIIG